MFRGLINDVKSAVGSLIAKYLARASVAVPFFVALGFATAAITLTLIERFGTIDASWIMAGGFTLIGLIATLAIAVKEQEEVAEKQAEVSDTAAIATDVAAEAGAQIPLALLGAIFSNPMIGPSTIAGAAKLMARNFPLVVLLALIALLFWPSEPKQEADTDVNDADEAYGARPSGAASQRILNGHDQETAA